MTEGQPARPANILNIVAINQGRLPLTMDEPVTDPMDIDTVMARIDEGALLVDTRSSAAFGKGHVPGSYNVQITSPEFEQRIGWITDPDAPLILVLEADEIAAAALHKMAFVGLDRQVAGLLSGGVEAWLKAGQATAAVPQITVEELHRELDKEGGMGTLDVREAAEWSEGHIEDAHMMSYKDLGERWRELRIPIDRKLAVICGSGVRSSTACSILRREGYENLYNVTGGMNAWKAAGLPMIDDEGCVVCAT